MLEIHLQAMLPHGAIQPVGRYYSEVPPQQNEIIQLVLHERQPNEEEPPYPNTVWLLVNEIAHRAYNTLATEEWITPYQYRCEQILVTVEECGEDARKYFERLSRKKRES